MDVILSGMKPNQIAHNLDTLLKHGAEIDIDELVSSLDVDDLPDDLDNLLKHGADVNQITRKLKERDIKRKSISSENMEQNSIIHTKKTINT